MRVLIACEYSGRVRDAFLAAGHDALSCDLLPTDAPGPHYTGDVADLLEPGRWDLLIAFPPCTHLAVSGARYFAKKAREQADALAFVQRLLDAPVPRICLENPIGVISSRIRKPTQIIQPWQFGHPESKSTCLWLTNLPPLVPTDILTPPRVVNGRPRWDNQTDSGQNRLSPHPLRWKYRSATYPGIAAAMAAQWGSLPITPVTGDTTR
jgi:hypothetical protein